MNGTSRLYRSASEAMLGGVAAGLGNYFKIDPVIVRALFVIATFFTGGVFVLAYIAMWLLIPTAASTATHPGEIVQENINDMGAKVRGFVGAQPPQGQPGNPGNPTNGNNGNSGNSGNAVNTANVNSATGNSGNGGNTVNTATASNGNTVNTSLTPTQASAAHGYGIGPMILILIGVLFLLGNVGFFHVMRWGAWWPFFMIGFGVLMLSRRRRW